MRLIKRKAGSRRASAPVSVRLSPVMEQGAVTLDFYSGKPDDGTYYMIVLDSAAEIKQLMSAIHKIWNGFDDALDKMGLK